jgi:hypothetical protein
MVNYQMQVDHHYDSHPLDIVLYAVGPMEQSGPWFSLWLHFATLVTFRLICE